MAKIDKTLAKRLRKAGLKVSGVGGWERRGRPGAFSPKGITCHHTGGGSNSSTYVKWMGVTGRSDLPAPLCQFALDRDGKVYFVAAGRANHAGKTRSIGGWLHAGDGNAQLIGIEAMNTGSEGWSNKQYKAYVTLCAEICKHFGWTSERVVGHKETSVTGKWDPGKIDMDKFRRDVRLALKNENTAPKTNPRLPSPEGGNDWPIWLKTIQSAERRYAKKKKAKPTTSVRRLQYALNRWNDRSHLWKGNPLAEDGLYDARVRNAVRLFQRSEGTLRKSADGLVGPLTLKRVTDGNRTRPA